MGKPNQTQDDIEWWGSITRAAEVYGTTRPTIARAVKEKRLVAVVLGPRTVRVALDRLARVEVEA